MANSERLEVELPADLARFVHAQVGQGALASDGDVVRAALRILQDHHEQTGRIETALDDARRKIAEGLAALRSGDAVDGDAFMAALDAELAGWGRSRA